MMDIIVINCTVPSKKLAKDITKVLMKHKLVACVSMVENVKSVFSWDGEICEEKEILMMMKTRRANYGKVKLVIEDMHTYSVPEIIALPIVDCSEDYLKWLVKETES
jgi:periplasmic divalent cation tolerance protein